MIKRNNAGLPERHGSRGSARILLSQHESWRCRLADLATACAGTYAEAEDERIRDAHDLLAQAPHPGLIAGLVVPAPSRIEGLIASGAGASAALAMLGEDSGYLLSRGSGGEHLASVVLPGSGRDVSACGDTPALALVGAMARALAEFRPEGTLFN